MSAGNINKSGAAYEAVLVDKVTAEVDVIVKKIEQLKTAFESLRDPAKDANEQLNGVAQSMKTMAAESKKISRTSNLAAGIQKFGGVISSMSQSIGQSLLHIGNQLRGIGVVATGVFAGMAAGFYKVFTAAADAQETISAFNAVFQDSASGVGAWADNFADSIGRSSTQMKAGLISFRAFFTGMGFADDEADDMSKTMQRLSIDFSSFFNLLDEEGMRRFVGALAGQSENLLRFGVNVQEASLSNTKFAKSLGKTSQQMTQMEKASARFEIITERLKKLNIEGDAFRTRFSPQNQLKAMTAGFNDMAIAVGRLTEGPIVNVFTILSELFDSIGSVSPKQLQMATGFMLAAGAAGAGLIAVGTAMATIGPAIIALGSALGGAMVLIGSLIATPTLIAPAAVASVVAATAAFVALKTAVTVDFAKFLDIFSKGFAALGKTAEDGIAGIADALEVEDWDGAWEAFELAGEAAMERIAKTFRLSMYAAINNVSAGIKDIFAPAEGNVPSWSRQLTNFFNRGTGQMLGDALSEVFGGGMTDAEVRSQNARLQRQEERVYKRRLDSRFKDPSALLFGDRPQLGATFRAAEAAMDAIVTNATASSMLFGDRPKLGATADPIEQIGEVIKRSFTSVGGFGAQFATNAAAFGPVMSPLERTNDNILAEQKETNVQLRDVNQNLKAIDFDGAVFI